MRVRAGGRCRSRGGLCVRGQRQPRPSRLDGRAGQCMYRDLAAMLLGAALALTGVAMTAYTLVTRPEDGVDIGGGFVAFAGLFLLALAGAMRGE